MILQNFKKIDGVVTLDYKDHKYLVDDIKVENQISVTRLIGSDFSRLSEPTPAMVLGTQVHSELREVIGQDKPVDNCMIQTQMLVYAFKRDLITSQKDQEFTLESVALECPMGIVFQEDLDSEPLYIFGSFDALVVFDQKHEIWEFKTSHKEWPIHKKQLMCYRALYALYNPDIDVGMKLITLDGCRDHSSIGMEECFSYLKSRIDKLKPTEIVGTSDIATIYNAWISQKEETERLKEILDASIESAIGKPEGEFRVKVGGIEVNKTLCKRTNINKDLVSEKLPEALSTIEYFRTEYKSL